MTRATRFTTAALAFEGGLGLLAAVLGWLLGHCPWESMHGRSAGELGNAFLWGVAATVPMVLALFWMDRWPVGPLAPMKQFVQRQVVPLFADLSVGQLALLSLGAGIGEELLFRGLLQAGISEWIGSPPGVLVGLIAASVIFGVCHWLTALYALLATIVGVYLGGLFVASGSLLTPIVAHALYDFVALVYLVGKSRESAASPESGVERPDPEPN